MSPAFPTLLVSRRPRELAADWSGARSWLGGAPRLGRAAWPRDAGGEPLDFVAQIALAEVAAETGPTPLPATGSLAFFIGREGAVIHVPEGQDDAPTLPPSGTPALGKFGGSEDWPHDLDGRRLFPYWPVRFAVLDIPPPPQDMDADDIDAQLEVFGAAQVAAVERRCPRRQYNLSPDQAFAGPPIPDWWQNAIHFSDQLARASRDGQGALPLWRSKLAHAGGDEELHIAKAAVEKLEQELAALHTAQQGFGDYVAEVAAWTAGRDPWALMSDAELAQLAAYRKRNTEFPELTGQRGVTGFDWFKTRMLKALPAAGEPAYAGFPAPVRDLVAAHRAPRPMWWHSAICFAGKLQEALHIGVPRASRTELQNLAADRKLLEDLQPSGVFGGFGRRFGGKATEIAEIEARMAANKAKIAERLPAAKALETFVGETTAWVEGRDPWTEMAGADIERLKAGLARAEKEFRAFVGYIQLAYLETPTLRAMLTGPERAYAALPESVRARVNRDYLLPPEVWHQMFGRGVEIQGDSSAMREEGNIMLLQLTYDDLMEWSFGDNGIYQFWIAPDDLASRNWSAAKMSFESH